MADGTAGFGNDAGTNSGIGFTFIDACTDCGCGCECGGGGARFGLDADGGGGDGDRGGSCGEGG